jgi:hypothetical protein
MLLSNVRQREERLTEILKEVSDVAKDPHIKEALESPVFLKSQMLDSLDRCFKLIGEQPMKQTPGCRTSSSRTSAKSSPPSTRPWRSTSSCSPR